MRNNEITKQKMHRLKDGRMRWASVWATNGSKKPYLELKIKNSGHNPKFYGSGSLKTRDW